MSADILTDRQWQDTLAAHRSAHLLTSTLVVSADEGEMLIEAGDVGV